MTQHHDADAGVLLVNTGTPDAPTVPAIRRFLREFLMDGRVIDLPAPMRWLLVNGVIAPLRPPKIVAKYAAIWMPEGAPLRVYGEQLAAGLREALACPVALGMRYGRPGIAEACDALIAEGVGRIVVAPLFPQYAAATVGSVLEAVYAWAAPRWNAPGLCVVPPFYDAPPFIDAFAAVAEPELEAFKPDHVLLSYHGLPEAHIRKSDPTGARCLETPHCCDAVGSGNRFCYRAQCMATTRALAARFAWEEDAYSVAFQSRFGRQAWLQPDTAGRLAALAGEGRRRVAVMFPGFVADGLETRHEIAEEARAAFIESGGEDLLAVSCLNGHPAWIQALAALMRPWLRP